MKHKLFYAITSCAMMNAIAAFPAFPQQYFSGKEIVSYSIASNACLVFSAGTGTGNISMDKTLFAAGESVDIEYKSLPENATIALYKNNALLPLKQRLTVSGYITGSGTFHAGDYLEEGDYTVRCTDASGASITNELFFSVEGAPLADTDKNIFVMSDIHVMSPELLVKEGSAFDSYLASDRKLLAESVDIFNAVTDSVLARKPQLVLIPGDLTKDGEKLSHQIVAAKLKQLKDAGIQTLVIPGNHDINNPHACYFNEDNTEYAETVSRDEFAELYKDFGYGNNAVRDPYSLSYAVEPLKDLVVIGIDACRYEDNTFVKAGAEKDECVTAGRIKPETLEWITKQAEKARNSGKQVIAFMHHNLVEHFNMQASIASPYVVDDAADIRQTLMDAGIHTVFTGHFHIQDIAMDYNTEKTDSIYDISTGSTVTYPCPFRLVSLNGDNTIMNITSKLIKSVTINGTEQKNFGAYARNKLAEGITPMVSSLVTDYWDVIKAVINENLGDYAAILNFPETPAELSRILIDCFGEQVVEAYLTFSESNENRKAVDELINRIINNGLDALAEKIVQPAFINLANPVLHNKVDALLRTVLESILYDISNNGTDNANRTDDLALSIKLPEQTPSGIYNVADEYVLKVFPLITDGDITITVPAEVENAKICIYDLGGRIIYDTLVKTEEKTTISYSFKQKGTYLVKLTGQGKATKVIVK